MLDSKFSLSKGLQTLLTIFLVGLFVFWGFKIYEIWITASGDYPREISVDAVGKAYVVPDTAVVNLGVYIEGETSEEVVDEGTEIMNEVMTILEEQFEIPKEDVKTVDYYLSPLYNWNEIDGSYTDGYYLDQMVEVKTTDFAIVGDVIDAVTEAGTNVIGSVNYVIDDLESAKQLARLDAIANVKKKAEAIEEASGIKLGKVLSYYEYSSYYGGKGGYYDYDYYGAESYSASPILEPGQEEIELTVTMSYRIK